MTEQVMELVRALGGAGQEDVLRALCGGKGVDFDRLGSFDAAAYRERQYDLLAQAVRENLDMELIYRILDKG